MTTAPCPRCLKLAIEGRIRPETVMALPEGAFAPLGHNKQKCCFDCQSADNLVPRHVPEFVMARIAVGNDRQEALRLPAELVNAVGLINEGLVKTWPNGGDFDAHIKWLDQHVWPIVPEEERS
jgi:hypothetical protein